MRSGPAGGRLLVPGLVAPDVLPRQPERPGDRDLLNALRAGLGDGAAERKARFGDPPARGQVGVTGGEDFAEILSRVRA